MAVVVRPQPERTPYVGENSAARAAALVGTFRTFVVTKETEFREQLEALMRPGEPKDTAVPVPNVRARRYSI